MDRQVPALSVLTGAERPGACPVCGTQECHPPPVEHLDNYPFLPGGKDPMAGKDFVIAPHRIVHGGRVLYGTGDRVPMADAIRFGLATADTPSANAPEPTNAKKGRRTRHHPSPAEDR